MRKKTLSILCVLSLLSNVQACGKKNNEGEMPSQNKESQTLSSESSESSDLSGTSQSDGQREEGIPEGYYETSDAIYEEALGDFYTAYESALQIKNNSKRLAGMAIAEAKLMEAAVMLPTATNGGRNAISRVAPYTVGYALWGNDSNRFHQALVCTEFVKSDDRTEMKKQWKELRGTGTYEKWAKSFLNSKGYQLTREYRLPYSANPTTWDPFATSQSVDSYAIVNTYDGLYEYDMEGILRPALADRNEVSEDQRTYTFYLKQGVKWVDYQGKELGELKAGDFVSGMQHMCDARAGLEYLVDGRIKNISGYINGELTDFSQVGVRAVNDYTLEYTLEEPCPYFMSMLSYGVFAPLCTSYYEGCGGKFGAGADFGTYGTGFDKIAYCGPYLVTNATANNTIVFVKNESYWNKERLNIDKIIWLYNDGSDETKAYQDAKKGSIAGCNLTASTLRMAKDEGLFATYGYVSATNATTFSVFYNLNRNQYANASDNTKVLSPKTEKERERTWEAMQNVHFRRALCMALDREKYNAQVYGEDVALNSLRNCYTPGTFVRMEEDVEIEINGSVAGFAKGTAYGQIVQAQLDADGMSIKVFDPAADDGNGSSDGFDGWYSPKIAKAEMETAIAELSKKGVIIDEKNPIQVDYPYPSTVTSYANRANAYKKSMEAALEGKVQMNLVDTTDANSWQYAGYFTKYGYEANYDLYDLSGWTPDYGDPSSYLDTFLPDGAGFMVKCIGIY